MHTCIVCGNSTIRTKQNLPEVLYHGFPKKELLRKKWLSVFGMDFCYDWQRVCSNHFLKEDYRPGKKRFLLSNTIPQPYEKNCDSNGFCSNDITQSNDVEAGNNKFVQMEQNVSRKQNTENAVVNNNKSPRRSSRKIKFVATNRNMNYGSMPRLQSKQFEIASDNIQTSIQTDIETDKVPEITTIEDFETRCSIPGCITNTNEEVDNISFFTPKIECVNEWSSNLGLRLTVNSIVCERHFRPQDILSPKLSVNGKNEIMKSLAPFSLPVPINEVQSASNAMSETNAELLLSTHKRKLKRPNANKTHEQLPKKKIRNNVLDSTNQNISTCDTRSTLISNTVENNNLPNNTDKKIQKSLTTIDHSSSNFMLNLRKKLKNFSANSSLSITLEPIENSVIEPSVELCSKKSAKSSLSITLQSKLKHVLSSTTNNGSPSVSGTHNFPSTSNSSMYNISPISLTNKSNSSELTKIDTPVTSKCISLARKSGTHNSNNSTNTSQTRIIHNDNIADTHRFIFKISKIVVLPSLYWEIQHLNSYNATLFYEQDSSCVSVKRILFYNSFVPIIQIYGKRYKYNKLITTQNELENLLEKIDSFEKCCGMDGFFHKNCIGYVEGTSEDIEMCSECQGLITEEDLHKMNAIIESKSKTIESLENKISERTKRVLQLRKIMEANKKKSNSLKALNPSGITNSVKRRR